MGDYAQSTEAAGSLCQSARGHTPVHRNFAACTSEDCHFVLALFFGPINNDACPSSASCKVSKH